jgi:hypothetical protein
MAKKKTTHGGARKGAGRKPIDDPRESMFIYPKAAWLNKVGKERARELAEKAIEREYKKLK